MIKRRVAVTGLGAISAAGPDVPAMIASFDRASRLFELNRKFDLDFDVMLGCVDFGSLSNHEQKEWDSPTGRLCLHAAGECVSDAQKGGAKTPDSLVLGTSTGGQSNNEEALFCLIRGQALPSFHYYKQGCMAAATRLTARELNILGPIQTISTACTSSSNAVALGAMWIASGRCDRVLAGGGDAHCHTTISGFHILGLTGPNMCAPFGKNRPGITLGEGAGFLMLESLDSVRAEGREVLAELAGWGMSSDAHHMTAPAEDGGGGELAMRRALTMSGMNPEDVGHVNAHGTGTELNDAAEALAINRVLGASVPVMSCKGLVGHTLGGAGSIEAVMSVISIKERRAFENIGATEAADDCPIKLVPRGGQTLDPGKAVMSNSFAFGGNNCVLLFKAAAES